MLSATKLVRLAQTYSEEQGREQANINDVLHERLAGLEHYVDTSPILPRINTADFSKWMARVDEQLQGLWDQVVVRTPADGGHTEGGRVVLVKGDRGKGEGLGGRGLNETAKEEGEANEAPTTNGVGAAEALARVEERIHGLETVLAEKANTDSPQINASDKALDEIERRSAEEMATMGDRVRCLEASLADLANSEGQQGSTRSQPLDERELKAAKELAQVEKRVRRLETSLAEHASAPFGQDNHDKTIQLEDEQKQHAVECDRGRRLKRCAKLPRKCLSRSRSPQPPPPPMTETIADDTEPANNVLLLSAVEESAAVAQRANEVVEEALKVGRETAERSERTGTLVRSILYILYRRPCAVALPGVATETSVTVL